MFNKRTKWNHTQSEVGRWDSLVEIKRKTSWRRIWSKHIKFSKNYQNIYFKKQNEKGITFYSLWSVLLYLSVLYLLHGVVFLFIGWLKFVLFPFEPVDIFIHIEYKRHFCYCVPTKLNPFSSANYKRCIMYSKKMISWGE